MLRNKEVQSLVSISYHDTVKILQGTIASAGTPFARREWLEMLAEADSKPLIAFAKSDSGSAILPLSYRNNRLESLTNWYNFTWHPQLEGDRIALNALANDLKSKSHRVTLWPIADESGEASMLEDAFVKAGWRVTREQCDQNHVLPVNGRSFSEYWAGRPGKMRTTLKRKAKKVEIEILTQFDLTAWSDYEAVYQASWKPEEGDPVLLRRFAEQEGKAGRLRLAIAKHEDRAVAAQFWTVEDGVAYIHKLAHLEESKSLSAGTSLSAALFERVIDTDKVDLVDFGTGNDAYKADWMEQVRPRFRIDCLDPKQAKAWPALAKRVVRRLAPSARQS